MCSHLPPFAQCESCPSSCSGTDCHGAPLTRQGPSTRVLLPDPVLDLGDEGDAAYNSPQARRFRGTSRDL